MTGYVFLLISLIFDVKLVYSGVIYGARISIIEPNTQGIIVRNESVTLECQYELIDSTLYMVKWYRGNREFYRYVPAMTPPFRIFPIQGLFLDISASNDKRVRISGYDFTLSGNYSCEISADSPHFSTKLVTTEIKVIELPKRGPMLMAEKGSYEAGDILQANCSSGPAKPAPQISFYINNVAVGKEWVKVGKPILSEDGMETAYSELNIRLLPPYVALSDGLLKLSCEAQIYTYWRNSAILILKPKKQINSAVNTSHPKPQRVTLPNSSSSLSQELFFTILFLTISFIM